MSVPETQKPIILMFCYKELEPDEYDATKRNIEAFIDEQGKAYRKTLESAIEEHKITTYRPEVLDRTVAHFKGLLDEAIQCSTSLEVWLYPKYSTAEYRIKEEVVYLNLLESCPWRDFILYSDVLVASNNAKPVIKISTELSDTLVQFEVKKASIVLSLLNSGIFKDFLIGSNLELTTEQGTPLTIIGKEDCF